MKKKIILTVLIVVSILIASLVYTAWSKPRTLELWKKFPDSLSFCNKDLGEDSIEYQEIRAWLQKNPDGWKNNSVNYATNTVFFGNGMNINFTEVSVVVNFQNDRGGWDEVVREKAADELVYSCH